MWMQKKFAHERGDYMTIGITAGVVLGGVGGLVFGGAAIGIGALVGAGAGLVAGAVLDAWADRTSGRGGSRRHSAGLA